MSSIVSIVVTAVVSVASSPMLSLSYSFASASSSSVCFSIFVLVRPACDVLDFSACVLAVDFPVFVVSF